MASSTSAWAIKLLLIDAYTSRQWNDGTMESNTKSAYAENHLFETSDNIVQKR